MYVCVYLYLYKYFYIYLPMNMSSFVSLVKHVTSCYSFASLLFFFFYQVGHHLVDIWLEIWTWKLLAFARREKNDANVHAHPTMIVASGCSRVILWVGSVACMQTGPN